MTSRCRREVNKRHFKLETFANSTRCSKAETEHPTNELVQPMKLSSLPQIAVSELLNGFPHAIAILDPGLRIMEMNSYLEVLTGYTSAQARGIYGNFILRCNLGPKNQHFHKALETGESIAIEGNIINRDHKKIPVQFTISPLRAERGNVVGLLVVLEDTSLYQNKSQRLYDGAEVILGHSPKMQEVLGLIPVLAHTDATVLITGETGTGKDLIAEAIHKASQRARHPFIKINCGALPESLLESELFGYARGAFTGAVKDKPGILRLAHAGTIFLTEIGDLPMPLQVKILSVLDNKEFYPVGGTRKVEVDVRIIAATHRDLRELIQQGKFREDLFYRLNVLRIHLPALREREDDIRLLLDHFLKEFESKLSKSIKGFSANAFAKLLSYAYPGNVRELRNIIEYAANICQGEKIRTEHLPPYISTCQVSNSITQPKAYDIGQQGQIPTPEPLKPRAGNWNDIEKEIILDALTKTRGNRSQAAKMLGWGRTTLWRKLKMHGVV